MRFKKKMWMFMTLIVVAALFWIVGCGETTDPINGTVEPKTYRLGTPIAPETLNPIITDSAYSAQVWDLIYARLVQLDHNMEPVPHLASWDVTGDGLTYTFIIDSQAKWHDGKSVTSDDVLMTLKLNAAKTAGGVWYSRINSIMGIEDYREGISSEIVGFEAIDEQTFSITLEKLDVSFLQGLTYIYILPSHLLENVSTAELGKNEFFHQPVGAGPFRLVKHVTEQYLEFESFDEYIYGRPKLDRVILRIASPDSLLALMEKGELDVTRIPGSEAARFEGMDHVELYSLPFGVMQLTLSNLEKPYLQDKKVRQAFTYALDRDGMVRALLHGHGNVLNAPFIMPPWAVSDDIYPYAYDPDKAKSLLREVGWDHDTDLLLRVPLGDKPREQAATVIQQNLADVGVKVTIVTSDFPTLIADANAGNFDLAIVGFASFNRDPQLAAIAFHSMYVPDVGGSNYSNYANSRVDEIFQTAPTILDIGKRGKLFQELQLILNDELPWIPLYIENFVIGVNKRVQGVQPIPMWSIGFFNPFVWNVHEIDIED